MKIKVTYDEFQVNFGLVQVEKEVNVIESNMAVLIARLNESKHFVRLGDLILRYEAIHKIEKLQ